MTERIEVPKKKKRKIRRIGEKETYKYLVILEVDTIKQAVMKEKHLKNASGV